MRPAFLSGTVLTVVTAEDRETYRFVSLDVSAWASGEPTRLLTGRTVEIGPEGAVLRLPRLLDEDTRVTLRIALPERATLTRATVVSRRAPDLVHVVFDAIDPYERSRIRTFIETVG